MFRIVCGPSSWSIELYLTEIIYSVSQIFVVCLVGVWQRNFEPVVCVYGTTDPAPRTVHTHRWFKITLSRPPPSMYATCPVLLNLLNVTTPEHHWGKQYNSRSSSLCSFLLFLSCYFYLGLIYLSQRCIQSIYSEV